MPVPFLLRIIAADTRDIDALMTLMSGGFDPQFGEAWSAAQLAGTMVLDGSFARQAVDADGTAVGFTLSRAVSDEVELLLIAVDPRLRGRGIGRLLVEQVEKDGHSRGATDMYLEVRENNLAARHLYKALGFADVGRRINYYTGSDGERFAAITMRRKIQD
ncbi:GNAT family N-acetyltransferase [Polymorphobacter fuscus]|uniref:GNAT family N-acetyltransferase n=1 Tax=Sandarakinorhabdus fusca TaxID=1439888 RepID=A0A7C9GQ55_9SPHN|nr:GNAT family N-acetyltransferase [Polymorphobacter fuscus]KAB7645607.1 GNAT family N-acetyltransferase [Polymorphobacter fuscus]MQT18057.1 GNAT family N-acetyltransferase [Polymorphobacter fuscus]NJC08690.1 ribosomal-protein-alanine N-acetyltransferase [Polymorphobacter fuscus]